MEERQLRLMMNKTKGEILSYFEMVCPTDISFKNVKKKIHKEFDELTDDIIQIDAKTTLQENINVGGEPSWNNKTKVSNKS